MNNQNNIQNENDHEVGIMRNPLLAVFKVDPEYGDIGGYAYRVENKSEVSGDYSKLELVLTASAYNPDLAEQQHTIASVNLFNVTDHVDIYFTEGQYAIDTLKKQATWYTPGQGAGSTNTVPFINVIPLGEKVGNAIKESHTDELFAVFVDKDGKTIYVDKIEGNKNIDKVMYKDSK